MRFAVVIPDAVRKRLRVVVWAFTRLVPFALLLIVAFEWNGIPYQDYRDSLAYQRAGLAAQEGTSIYEPKPPPGPHEFAGEWFYLYPPPLAALLGFVPRMSYAAFDRAWLIGNMIAFWIFAAALGCIARRRWSMDGTLRWGAVLFLMPGPWLSMHFGNMELWILALVGVGLAVPPVGGSTVMLAALFKVTPVWPLIAMIARSPRRAGTGAAIALAACGLACLYAFGFAGSLAYSREWLTDIMPTVAQGQFWGETIHIFANEPFEPVWIIRNLSLTFLPVQLAVKLGWDYTGGELPTLVRLYLTGVATAAPIMAAWFTRHRSIQLQAAVIFAAAVFAAPIVRPYILPVILLVFAARARERRERAAASASLADACAVFGDAPGPLRRHGADARAAGHVAAASFASTGGSNGAPENLPS